MSIYTLIDGTSRENRHYERSVEREPSLKSHNTLTGQVA